MLKVELLMYFAAPAIGYRCQPYGRAAKTFRSIERISNRPPPLLNCERDDQSQTNLGTNRC